MNDRPERIRESAAEYATREAVDGIAHEVLDAIVARVVEAVQPDRIILFGSAARGQAGPDSDIDLLVVRSDVESRIRLEGKIYKNLIGIDHDIDVVVVTPDDVEYLGSKVGSVVSAAMREGREIYVAPKA